MIKIKIIEIHDSKKETFLFNKALIRKIFSNTFNENANKKKILAFLTGHFAKALPVAILCKFFFIHGQ